MAHEGTHAAHHETSPWGLPTGLVPLFLSLAAVAYFGWHQPLLALVLGGVGLVLFVLGVTGWAAEYFSRGKDEGLGFQGIIWFVFAEVVIFGSVIAGFWTARVTHATEWVTKWIPEGGMNLSLVALLTVILWISSYTIWRAEKSLEHGDVNGYRLWLIATMVLGSLFILLHALEWNHLWQKGFTISANMYGTGFYTLTGIHASHVLVGIGMQLILLLNSSRALGKITPIRAASYYWHFVDLAWLLVAGTAYIVGSYGRF
ncbi:cytochrome c oxidase subunit III [Thermocrinis albus DSM 14484]|uniref:Cytochrome c oxidase subunit III n=1 Tax=Thermocrinis albus (strain DSM 14484 / JCM 11386 / HI 11/12) TaxID=638303 RepID=D3SN64_THEAH|nr:heme-copper oxidase subunit III [Thermocrinis albus]ADC90194.1 cytochrome c oxidase subunit III [Thermocrinis albus DSM 14484]